LADKSLKPGGYIHPELNNYLPIKVETMENVEKHESGKSGMLKFFAIIVAIIVALIALKMVIG
jgi:hypothetical protein